MCRASWICPPLDRDRHSYECGRRDGDNHGLAAPAETVSRALDTMNVLRKSPRTSFDAGKGLYFADLQGSIVQIKAPVYPTHAIELPIRFASQPRRATVAQQQRSRRWPICPGTGTKMHRCSPTPRSVFDNWLAPVASSKCDLGGGRYEGPAAISYAAAVLLLVSNAEAVGADKNQYWLFNPTPDRLLREMTTDRPDITESPFTVDAGHVSV